MQYRRPVGAGPSSKTWPRWESASRERTSVRRMKSTRSVLVVMFSGSSGLVRDVMVAGRWVVRERHHALEEKAAQRYARTLAQLLN